MILLLQKILAWLISTEVQMFVFTVIVALVIKKWQKKATQILIATLVVSISLNVFNLYRNEITGIPIEIE